MLISVSVNDFTTLTKSPLYPLWVITIKNTIITRINYRQKKRCKSGRVHGIFMKRPSETAETNKRPRYQHAVCVPFETTERHAEHV